MLALILEFFLLVVQLGLIVRIFRLQQVDSIGKISAVIPKGINDRGQQALYFGTTKAGILKGRMDDKLAQQELYPETTNAGILKGCMDDKLVQVFEAHHNTVCSIVAHPREHNSFFTASDDRTVRKWSADKHKLMWTKSIDRPCICLDIDGIGKLLAVGTKDGYVILMGSSDKDDRTRIKVGNSQESIECVKFSPTDRAMLAVGCIDGSVYIYNDVNNSNSIAIRQSTIFKANDNAVLKIDWSNTCHYIQTVTSAFEQFHWDVTDMKSASPKANKDVEWATHDNTVGYSVTGAWTNMKDREMITAVSRVGNCLAAGDSKGRIRLYRYPCAVHKPDYNRSRIHGGDVTAMCFLVQSDSERSFPNRLVSSGTPKEILAQWTVLRVPSRQDYNENWNQSE